MTAPLHVLIVDDEPRIRAMLRRYLGDQGFRVSEAADGGALRAVLEREPVDLVLLDLVMPGEDGLALARVIRQRGETPIIMLSGKGDLIDRVVGLEAGADDYITKPFELREVLARIRTVLRRAAPRPAAAAAPPASAPAAPAAATPGAVAGSAPGPTETAALSFQGWRLDLVKRELHRPDGAAVALTAGEFDLLRVFALHPNRVLSRAQLLDLVKGRDWAAFDRAVDTQVGRLRKKVEDDPANPGLIKTVRGGGYIFAAAVTAS